MACRSTVAARSQAIPASDPVGLIKSEQLLTSTGLLRLSRGGLFAFFRGASRCFALVALLSGCDPGPSDVREWAASDHDQPASAPGQVSARPGTDGPDPTLINMAWTRNCAQCHGPVGRGDGPQGAMMRAPDLTRGEWQDDITDEEMAAIIRKGKNKMPAFDLPDLVIDGLVQRIRAARAK